MLKLKLLAGAVAVAAIALPAQAGASGATGVVVAKRGGTVVLVGAGGLGRTVHASASRLHLGDRVLVQGTKLRVLGHLNRALVRGIVVRQLAHRLLVADGGAVLSINLGHARAPASVGDHGGMQPGQVMQVGVSFQNDQLDEDGAPAQLGQATSAQIEGRIVSLSPLVVSVEGLPITITVPAGTALPSTLAVGQQIELTVGIGAANTFTLTSLGSQSSGNEDDNGQSGDNNQGDDNNGGGDGGDGGGGGDG